MALEALLSTRAQRFFMVTILLQGFVVLAMVATVFAFVEEDVDLTLPQYKTVPCYLALFILAEIFELLMAFDALRLRNVIQLMGILGFHLGLIVFAAIQIHETRAALVRPKPQNASQGSGPGSLWEKVLPYLIVSPCILGASWLALVFWIRELYFEFGWAIFHVVGANPAMKTMYQFYQIMICLLKFDFFCFIGVTTQLLIVVLQTNSAEFGVTIAAIPVVLFLLVGAGIAVQREIKWLMSISLVMMLAAESYFIFKLVRFYEPSSREQYQTTRTTLTVFTILAFLLLFATFAVGLRCFADFDKGLQSSKTHGQSYRPVATKLTKLDLFGADDDTEGGTQMQYSDGAQLQPRISIE
ncbi:uncharacterized protein PHACADRAFT_256055 [Phanerochaete carnosa HHB-10118-sp]|uniref:Uncharacterized protein n=1 Tax=Phanerochaete carnosa (strain HHB-10118-sp) TaxID=650164 RepID=K5UZ45_PHACS|nr:uncharacterized protein PHACADRAFT_256055 [Phanerochaete carnosa HHB-10118-sp]EKM55431.1 hypothetical protein PHACADRAFT_256055 [Phanerochaete carnosa HHB-10118-sp]